MPRLARPTLSVLVVALLMPLSACKRAPMLEVQEAELATPAGATLAQVGEAIERAVDASAWRVTGHDPGLVRALYLSRSKHSAEVAVRYTLARFSIEHASSYNLNHKTERSITYIHPVYNDWVARLRDRILLEVSRIAP